MWEIRSKSVPKAAYFLNFKWVKSVFLLSVFIFLCFFFLVLAHFDEAPFYLFGPHWIICVVAVFIRLTHSDKQRIVSQQTSSIIRHALASHSRIGTCQVWLEHTQLRLCEFSSGCFGFPPPSESIQVRFIHSGGAPKCTIFGLTLHLQPLLLMLIFHFWPLMEPIPRGHRHLCGLTQHSPIWTARTPTSFCSWWLSYCEVCRWRRLSSGRLHQRWVWLQAADGAEKTSSVLVSFHRCVGQRASCAPGVAAEGPVEGVKCRPEDCRGKQLAFHRGHLCTHPHAGEGFQHEEGCHTLSNQLLSGRGCGASRVGPPDWQSASIQNLIDYSHLVYQCPECCSHGPPPLYSHTHTHTLQFPHDPLDTLGHWTRTCRLHHNLTI